MSVANRPITLTLTRTEVMALLGCLTTVALMGLDHEGEAALSQKLMDAIREDERVIYAEYGAGAPAV